MTRGPLTYAIQPPKVLRFENKDGSGQTYELVAVRRAPPPAPSRHREAVWKTTCQCCGAEFLISAPATRRAIEHRTGAMFISRCLSHRRSVTSAAIALDRQLRGEFGSDDQ